MKNAMRIALAALAALLLCGCFGADPKVEKAGKQLMERYLSEHYQKARLGECDELVRRPEADRLEGTSWVHGGFTADGGAKYAFWADTADGRVYTDERVKELSAAGAEALAGVSGLPGGSVVAYVYPVLVLDDITLHGVLPAGISDMRAYFRGALYDGAVMLRIYAGGRTPLPEKLSEAAEGWDGVSLTWYALDALPAQSDAEGYAFWDALEAAPDRLETPGYHE